MIGLSGKCSTVLLFGTLCSLAKGTTKGNGKLPSLYGSETYTKCTREINTAEAL